MVNSNRDLVLVRNLRWLNKEKYSFSVHFIHFFPSALFCSPKIEFVVRLADWRCLFEARRLIKGIFTKTKGHGDRACVAGDERGGGGGSE